MSKSYFFAYSRVVSLSWLDGWVPAGEPWDVGLGSGETQEPEWFGPDCSLRHCPSGDDPETTDDETDCEGVMADGSRGNGTSGNLCQVDCSNRGLCDYRTGVCKCFNGYYEEDCASTSELAVYD